MCFFPCFFESEVLSEVISEVFVQHLTLMKALVLSTFRKKSEVMRCFWLKDVNC